MKIIRINNCLECPYINAQNGNVYCDNMIINSDGMRKIISTFIYGKTNGFPIPQWCPLENDIYKDLPTDLAENHDKYLADEYEGRKHR